MGSATAKRSIRDTVVRSDQARQPHGQGAVLPVVNGSVIQIPYIQVPLPCPHGCTVLSAKLQLFQKGTADSGDRNLSLTRPTHRWREGKLKYNHQPDLAVSPSVTVTVTGAGSEGRKVEFDVRDDYQSFVDGSFPNFGWAVKSSNGNAIKFHSSEASSKQPRLVVTWTTRPQAPTDVVPSGSAFVATPKPVLRWSFLDFSGDTTLAAVQVQLKGVSTGWSDEGGFTSPVFDSGEQSSTRPQYDLSTSGWAGNAAGASVYCTIRHKDGAGLWSKWSDPVQFGYQPYTSATLNSPAATVNDTTFPWSWTTSSQVKYQLLILDAQRNVVWDSTEVNSTTERSFETPRDVVRRTGVTLTAVLRLWDTFGRQAVPGFPVYKQLEQDFTYADTGTVAPVTDLTATPLGQQPGVVLAWAYAGTMPDQFTVWVDGVYHTVIDGPDAFVSGTSFTTTLYDLDPRVEHAITVKAVIIDTGVTKSSASNPSVTITIDYIGVWLIDPLHPELAVMMLEESGQDIVSTTMPEVVEHFEPIGSPVVVQATGVMRWYSGTVTDGVLADTADSTADEKRARVLAMKFDRTSSKLLIWGNDACPVWLSNVNVADQDIPSATRYTTSFDFASAIAPPDFELA